MTRLELQELDIAESLRRDHEERQFAATGIRNREGVIRDSGFDVPIDAMNPEQLLSFAEEHGMHLLFEEPGGVSFAPCLDELDYQR